MQFLEDAVQTVAYHSNDLHSNSAKKKKKKKKKKKSVRSLNTSLSIVINFDP